MDAAEASTYSEMDRYTNMLYRTSSVKVYSEDGQWWTI
jgi:hypothetical protein